MVASLTLFAARDVRTGWARASLAGSVVSSCKARGTLLVGWMRKVSPATAGAPGVMIMPSTLNGPAPLKVTLLPSLSLARVKLVPSNDSR